MVKGIFKELCIKVSFPFFNGKIYFIFSYVDLCVYKWAYAHECRYLQRPEGIGSLGAGVRNDCKLSIRGTGQQTYNSYKSGMHSLPPRAIPQPL